LTLDLKQLPNLQTPTGYGVAIEFSMLTNTQNSVFVLGASKDTSNHWDLSTNTSGDTTRIFSAVAGNGAASAPLSLRTAGLINRAALSIIPAGVRWVLNGSAVTNLSFAGQPVMNTLGVGRLPVNSTSFAAMHATTVTLIPGAQSDAWLSAMAY
jgi:hypothetical protein